MNFPFAKFPFTFNVKQLVDDFNVCREKTFSRHFNTYDFEGNWEGIALRSVTGDSKDLRAHSEGASFKDTPLLKSSSYFKKVIDCFLCDKESVRTLVLAANSKIKPHRDLGLSYKEGLFRVHVPIITSDLVKFSIANLPVVMREGECWYGDFSEMHWVHNTSSKARVHLIMDCKRNAWSDDLFANLNYPFEKENEIEEPSKEVKIEMIKALKLQDNEAAKALIIKLEKEIGFKS